LLDGVDERGLKVVSGIFTLFVTCTRVLAAFSNMGAKEGGYFTRKGAGGGEVR